MRSLLLASLLVFAVPVAAQTSYDIQKAVSRAVRFDTLEELRATGNTYIGKVIELRGQTKGNFSRGDGFAVLMTLTDGQSVVVDAPAQLRETPISRPGTWVRMLCKVNSLGNDPSLLVQMATDKPEAEPLLKQDDNDGDGPIVMSPNALAPKPGDILIGPGADMPVAIVTGPSTLSARNSILPRGVTADSLTPSPAGARTRTTVANPYYGFTEATRAAYKAMARRNNPRLRDDMADYIAASILSAAQQNNLDPRFLASVVQVESSFDPYCVSSAGAMGLGQLMPFNLKPLGVGNAWDPAQNLSGAAKMLRRNLNTYAKFPNGTLLAVAAYHAGVGAVNRAGFKVPKLSTNRYAWKVYYAYRALAPELFN